MIIRWFGLLASLLIAVPTLAMTPVEQWVTPDQKAPLIWQQVRNFETFGESDYAQFEGDALILPAGESVRFLMENRRYLRLDAQLEDGEDLSNLAVQQSADGAWFYPLAMSARNPDGVTVSLLPLGGDRAIWLRNQGEEAMKLVVSAGEYRPVPSEVTWQPQTLDELPGETLYRFPESALKHVYTVSQTDVHELTVEGPALYALSFREIQNGLSTRRRGRVTVALDGQAPDLHYLHFSPDRRHRYVHDGDSLLLSHEEHHYLWVPEGEHRVSLRSDHDLWFELLKAEHYRSTSRGSDRRWTETLMVLRERLMFEQQQTQWAIHELLTGGASAAELAAASFDSSASEGWQQGNLDSVFRRRYTQERALWPIGGAEEVRFTPLHTELNLTSSDDVFYTRPDRPGDETVSYFLVNNESKTLALPRTQGPTRLNLSLAHAEAPVELTVDIGGQQHQLQFDPQGYPDDDQLRLTARSQANLDADTVTAKHLVSDASLPLPQGVSRIQIRATGGAASLRVTVEEGRWPTFTEQEFWDFLGQLGPDAFLSSWKSAHHERDESGNTQGAQILDTARVVQDGQFLRNWLVSRYENFIEDLSPSVSSVSTRKLRANLESLSAAEDPALARRYAEGVFVYATDPDIRLEAYHLLKQMFASEGNDYGLQSLLATAFLHHGRLDVLPELAMILERNGYDETALKLAVVLLESGRLESSREGLQELVLRTSILADWPLTLQNQLQTLPDEEQQAWYELYLLEHFGAASEHSEGDTRHAITAFANGLPEPESVTAEAWLSEFRRDYPGLWRWSEWSLGFEGEVERVNIHNPDLDRYYQRHRVAPEAPLGLEVTGPVRLRINAALVHEERTSRLNDQLAVSHNGEDYRFVILKSGVFNRHRIIGADNQFPGSIETIEVTLGPGSHELAIAPVSGSALVQVEMNTPAFLSGLYLSGQTRSCHGRPDPWAGFVGERDEPTSLALATPEWAADTTADSTLCRTFLADASEAGEEKSTAEQSFMAGADVRFMPTPISMNSEPSELTPSRPQSRDKVSQFLSQVLITPGFANQPSLIARSNALAAAHPEASVVQDKLAAINEEQGWQQEDLVLESAGKQRFDSSQWSPSLPFLKNRQDLLGQAPASTEQLLFGMEPMVVSVANPSGQDYRLRLRLDKVGFQKVSPVAVDVRLNGDRLSRLELSEGSARRVVSLNLPASTSQLELQMLNPSSRHWVYFQLEQRSGSDGAWQAVAREQSRTYHKVLPGQPLLMYVDQPAWLRMEVFDGQRHTQRYRYHPAAGELTIRANELPGSYVRVYSLRHQPGRLTAQPPSSTPILRSVPDGTLQQANASIPEALVSDRLPMPDRDAGTHGAYADFVQRRNFDGASTNLLERFVEFGWRYQQTPLFSRFYWQSDAFARRHTNEDISVLGTQQWLTWRPDNRYWRITMSGGAFWQPEDSAGSAHLGLSFDGYMPLSNEWTLEHELAGFGRVLTEEAGEVDETSFDDDVFTRYKSNHQYGVDFKESLSYRPWRDSRFWFDAHLRTNEDLSPERYALALRWDQFWMHNTRTYLGIQQRWLQKDDDRAESATQQILGVGAEWHAWHNQGRRWFVRLDAGLDLDESEPALKLSIGLDVPGTKRLEDFRQERFPFFGFKEMNAARSVDTNELNYVE
ncbi:hypothetical protein [Marinobacter shengliensis]|uniref:hypothetical protein n=1 Tax=Marinobacter TaxID=2742 RepID=UPI001E61DCF8|nr:hypothetical protein [Marinobacter shengliensis]MCD1631933.1 hypothetical protein [Marinobacter shengliensis]